MKKIINISIIVLIIAIGSYHSVYFQKLDARKERESIKAFNPSEKVDHVWDQKLDEIIQSAINLNVIDSQLADNPETLIQQHGKSVGITSTYCFLVKGTAFMSEQGADELPVQIENGNASYNLQIKYIFGNSARDALGFFDIADFENTMDFNAVATEMNKRILQKEISKLDSLSAGQKIAFIGAIAVNAENIQDEMDIIPLRIEVVQ